MKRQFRWKSPTARRFPWSDQDLCHRDYRAQWLRYARDWLREADTNAFLQMPGSRTATSPETRWYFANKPSPAVPTGLSDEEAIRAIWAGDQAK